MKGNDLPRWHHRPHGLSPSVIRSNHVYTKRSMSLHSIHKDAPGENQRSCHWSSGDQYNFRISSEITTTAEGNFTESLIVLSLNEVTGLLWISAGALKGHFFGMRTFHITFQPWSNRHLSVSTVQKEQHSYWISRPLWFSDFYMTVLLPLVSPLYKNLKFLKWKLGPMLE